MFGFSVPGEVTMLTFVVSLTHLRRETLSVEELLPLNSHVDKDVGRFLDVEGLRPLWVLPCLRMWLWTG